MTEQTIGLMSEIVTDITPGNFSLIPFSITQERGCTDHDIELCWHVYIEVSTKTDCYEIHTGDAVLQRAIEKAVHRLRREIPRKAA